MQPRRRIPREAISQARDAYGDLHDAAAVPGTPSELVAAVQKLDGPLRFILQELQRETQRIPRFPSPSESNKPAIGVDPDDLTEIG
jgi:hypothetical protein